MMIPSDMTMMPKAAAIPNAETAGASAPSSFESVLSAESRPGTTEVPEPGSDMDVVVDGKDGSSEIESRKADRRDDGRDLDHADGDDGAAGGANAEGRSDAAEECSESASKEDVAEGKRDARAIAVAVRLEDPASEESDGGTGEEGGITSQKDEPATAGAVDSEGGPDHEPKADGKIESAKDRKNGHDLGKAPAGKAEEAVGELVRSETEGEKNGSFDELLKKGMGGRDDAPKPSPGAGTRNENRVVEHSPHGRADHVRYHQAIRNHSVAGQERAMPNSTYRESLDGELRMMAANNRVGLSLRHDEMGRLNINLSLNKGLVNVHINPIDRIAKEFIEHNLHQLMDALNGGGLNLGGFSLAHRDDENGGRTGMRPHEGGAGMTAVDGVPGRPAEASGMLSVYA